MNTKKMMAPVDMEARLANAFRPVRPSQNFMQTMHRRIEHITPPVVVARRRLDDSPRWLLVLGGVISGALLLAAGARALFYMVNKSKL